MADRQQNIRMAIDIIGRDLYRAGFAMPAFAQVFTDNLDGVGSTGSGGAPTDELEIYAGSECGHLQICDVNGSSITTVEELSSCYDLPSMVVLANANEWHPYWAEAPGHAVNNSCSGGGPGNRNGHVVVPPGHSSFNNPGGPNHVFADPPEYMIVARVIRYRINPGADGIPNLERSDFGGEDYPTGESSWNVIATGVEDLQAEYLNGAGWEDTPGTISCGASCANPGETELDTLIRRVRVRLSAQALAANLQGQTHTSIGDAVRGELVTEITPRPATSTLAMAGGS